MDNRRLLVEATISGEKGYYECPLTVRLYGTYEPIAREQLIRDMRNDRLPVQGATAQEREDKKRQKLAAQAAKQAKKKGSVVVAVHDESSMSEFVGGPSQGLGPGPTLEDIIGSSERFNPRNAEQFIEEFGIKEQDLVSLMHLTLIPWSDAM